MKKDRSKAEVMTSQYFRDTCQAKGMTLADAVRRASGAKSKTTIARMWSGRDITWNLKHMAVAINIMELNLLDFARVIEAFYQEAREAERVT